jgi:hypothetical protein
VGGEIDAHRIRFHQLGPPTKRLGAAAVHEFRTKNAVRKPRVIFYVGGGHQLAARDAPFFKPSDQHGREVGSRRVDRCCIARWPRPDDHQVLKRVRGLSQVFCLERGDALGAHGLTRSDYVLSLGPVGRLVGIERFNLSRRNILRNSSDFEESVCFGPL